MKKTLVMKRLVILCLLFACTRKSASDAASETSLSCNQQLTAEACAAVPNCVPESGMDVASKQTVFLGCLNSFSEALRCHGSISCFANPNGQRVVRKNSCQFASWKEVSCTEAEKELFTASPCDVASASECPLDQKCFLRSARDVVTRERVVVGCMSEHSLCGSAITCYTNPERTRRIVDSASCQTFPEWESSPCQPGDIDALRDL